MHSVSVCVVGERAMDEWAVESAPLLGTPLRNHVDVKLVRSEVQQSEGEGEGEGGSEGEGEGEREGGGGISSSIYYDTRDDSDTEGGESEEEKDRECERGDESELGNSKRAIGEGKEGSVSADEMGEAIARGFSISLRSVGAYDTRLATLMCRIAEVLFDQCLLD